ncbi:MAG: nucleoside 2-deoxyribosyltransferase [Caulobacteraceae bacterium]
MRPIRSIYLAGPQFTRSADGQALSDARALCLAAGFDPATPDPLTEHDGSEVVAREIYARRASSIRKADALIADLTALRGATCDPGTAFEAGFAAGLGRPVFAYMNVRDEDDAELLTRIEAYEGADIGDDGVWRDGHGGEIEDFGLPENLMLWAEARRLFVIVTPEDADLTGLQMCLEAVKQYAD